MSGQGDTEEIDDGMASGSKLECSKSSDGGGSTVALVKESSLSDVEEDFIIFHCVSYLGASSIEVNILEALSIIYHRIFRNKVRVCPDEFYCKQNPKSEDEIQRTITFLNEQSSDKVIEVSVSVPLHSDGYVMYAKLKRSIIFLRKIVTVM